MLAVGMEQVVAYSPEERREREANMFARELLLPSHVLQQLFVAEGLGATAIAELIGVPIALVHHQLGLALLAPELPPSARDEPPEKSLQIDPSQHEAARVSTGPLLVEAGPGTGKTRTLTGRVMFLLEQGVAPEHILSLTFSNKAAEEMRSRVALVAPDATPAIWMGTFHAFGLELLRQHGEAIGLPTRPRVIDTMDAIVMLEELLPYLPLKHYRNLHEPSKFLGDMLKTISRAKDELVDPLGFRALGQAMQDRATTNDQIIAAEKALEIAEVYAIYQTHLDSKGLLDFGDLIFKSVRLLRENSVVRQQVCQKFKHILVDEYQDVNRASGVLLKEIAGDGQGLWVVGDARQAIYRFRGAAPANMELFGEDFPRARTTSLQYNYRSQQPIIDVFAALAPHLGVAQGVAFSPWTPQRPTVDGHVLVNVAATTAAESTGIAETIKQRVAQGHQYRDHAVLCRTHTALAQVAVQLEAHQVPVLYLGNLFERSEISDLLSLISLASEGSGYGLLRVAQFAEYQIPLTDVWALLKLARDEKTPFPQAIGLAQGSTTISPAGKDGLLLLLQHLDGLCYGTSAWSLLVRYLFERSSYLSPILADTSVAAAQQRLAILQFIQIAYERRGIRRPGIDQKRVFLHYIRRLVQFGEDRQFRQLPDWAAGIDAVRLMTVHGAKGLEFPVVFLPSLAAGIFPSNKKTNFCPPPEGLVSFGEADGHMEEEKNLFFVALSRARDALYLSRPAAQPSGRSSNPSSFFELIAVALDQPFKGTVTWTGGLPTAEPAPLTSPFAAQTSFSERMLNRYEACPRQFYYEFGLGLHGKRDDNPYLDFHRCTYQVIRWIRSERLGGREVTQDQAVVQLRALWAKQGPSEHAYASIYYASAKQMVSRAAEHIMRAATVPTPEWSVLLEAGEVTFAPDHIEIDEGSDTVHIQRFRTGQPSDSEKDRLIYRLYAIAAETTFPKTARKVEIVYLASGHTDEVESTGTKNKNALGKYNTYIKAIQQGFFDPKPKDDNECARCPFYFVCPAHGG